MCGGCITVEMQAWKNDIFVQNPDTTMVYFMDVRSVRCLCLCASLTAPSHLSFLQVSTGTMTSMPLFLLACLPPDVL